MHGKARRILQAEGVILTVSANRVGSVMHDGSATALKLRGLIRRHKADLLEELKTHRVVRISGEDFYGPALMADAARRAKR